MHVRNIPFFFLPASDLEEAFLLRVVFSLGMVTVDQAAGVARQWLGLAGGLGAGWAGWVQRARCVRWGQERCSGMAVKVVGMMRAGDGVA